MLRALAGWQRVGGVFQLHPGDVGWFWRFGARATVDAVRVWSVDGDIAAVGLLDGPTLLRVALDPRHANDTGLADSVVEELDGIAAVEAPLGSSVREALARRGWREGERWVPLERDLSAPVEDCGLNIAIVDAETVGDRVAVQQAAFDKSTFTNERWLAMAEGPAYADAHCLLAYDDAGAAVATTTVWSAGPRRPGLIEPLGVHRDHRGRGYGRAMTIAAASALRELGSASVIVGTPEANVAAVAAYTSAGFEPRPAVMDLARP